MMVPSWALPPAPFGSLGAILAGHVNWTAVRAGLANMVALAFLYLLRSSIHASAMKKNVSNLVMRIPVPKRQEKFDDDDDNGDLRATIVAGNLNKRPSATARRRRSSTTSLLENMRQSVRIVNMSMQDKKPLHPSRRSVSAPRSPSSEQQPQQRVEQQPEFTEIRAKAPRRSLESIFSEYSYALFVVAVFGGFGVCPTVATSNTVSHLID